VKWLLRLLLLVLVPVLVVTVATAAWVVNVKYTNPRDEGAFIKRLDTGFQTARCPGKRDRCTRTVSTFAPIDDDFLLAEGDRACAWLAKQPYPWWRRDTRFTSPALISRYKKEDPGPRKGWAEGRLRPELRDAVVGQAWNDLCGAEFVLREPRNPFKRPADTD
jgi:hypothetical protein